MSKGLPKTMSELVDEFAKMPGIGRKSAERMAFYILKSPKETARRMAESIINMKGSIRFCSNCYNLSDKELCSICHDESRDKSLICVVEDPKDIAALEKSGEYNGLYHVLLGRLSPLDGIGPQDLKIDELVERIEKTKPKEVILATSGDTEGEATVLYLAKILAPLKVKLTRIAYGLPVGSTIEYADQATLIKAMEHRVEV